MVKAATANLEAYELYLRGRALLYRRGLSVPQALECFTRAVALDPDYAQAWTGMADAHTVLGQYGFAHPATTMPQAKDAALRAVELDDTLAEAHGALGGALLLHDWDPDAAERALERAVALNPGHIQARGCTRCSCSRGYVVDSTTRSHTRRRSCGRIRCRPATRPGCTPWPWRTPTGPTRRLPTGRR